MSAAGACEPRSSPALAEPAQRPVGGAPPRPSILVVEDNALIRGVVADVLRAEGYPVLEASNGHEGLLLAERFPSAIGLILLDMHMPVLDGWGFAAAYRARPGRRVPLVVMTAAQNAAAWAQEVGAAACVGKPFEIDALLSTVERHALPPHPPS